MEADKDTSSPPVVRPTLRADRTWYNSTFTQLLAPLVATRYIWLAIEEINPFNFLGKTAPNGHIASAPPWKEPNLKRYISRNFAAFGMGITFLGIVGMYSRNTLHDIKSIYAEAVGYELNKKPEDVTFADVFLRSKNEAVGVTRSAYTFRTLARIGTAATFFIPWHKFRPFTSSKPKYDVNANAGVGAIGCYLYGEGFLREPSLFDVEQRMVSTKINHRDPSPYITLQPSDILSLITLHRKHRDKTYVAPFGSSPAGQADIRLATHIADVMNQTYHNIPTAEAPHFTLGKFNFLLGFGLLDDPTKNSNFVELASRSKDMHEVKEAALAIKEGENPQTVFTKYGVGLTQPTIAVQSGIPSLTSGLSAASTADSSGHASRFAANGPRTHTDFAHQKQALTPGVA